MSWNPRNVPDDNPGKKTAFRQRVLPHQLRDGKSYIDETRLLLLSTSLLCRRLQSQYKSIGHGYNYCNIRTLYPSDNPGVFLMSNWNAKDGKASHSNNPMKIRVSHSSSLGFLGCAVENSANAARPLECRVQKLLHCLPIFASFEKSD